MFFSKPKPPVSEGEREWMEKSLMRLVEMFGREYFLSRRMILPKPEFFPDHFTPTEEGLEKIIERVCGYMDVDFQRIDFHIYSQRDDSMKKHLTSWSGGDPGAAGKYFGQAKDSEKFQIGIEEKTMNNPLNLVATIAHELGHVILLGGGKVNRDEDDHEFLTDLLTVFLGLGIFTANSSFQFQQWQGATQQGWGSSRQGYMSEPMFGYSLAACAWMRGGKDLSWEPLLTMNVRHYFKQSLKFLDSGGETLLKPQRE